MSDAVQRNPEGRLDAFPFALAFLSFIPLFGLPFGIVTLFYGLVTPKDGRGKLIALSGAGIASSIGLFLFLGFMIASFIGDAVDNVANFHERFVEEIFRIEINESDLNQLLMEVEFYKVRTGSYPDRLEDLEQAPGGTADLFAPVLPDMKSIEYKLNSDGTYFLYGAGPDGKLLTEDDVEPSLELLPTGSIGLRFKR